MNATILHVLSQRPLMTGSGVILDVFARLAKQKGWRQHAVVGVPLNEATRAFGVLAPEEVHPLVFGAGDLDFPVPGMSDVMPYESTRFSRMSGHQLAAYKSAWKKHLEAVISKVHPDVIHAHHVWLVSSLIKKIAPQIPVVNQCHATGLRQMIQCPHLEYEVIDGCRKNDRFLVAYGGQADQLSETLGISPDRIRMIGAGYDDALFHHRGRRTNKEQTLLYAGKLSRAKGVPWLLAAVNSLIKKGLAVELHVAGSGAGTETEEIKATMNSMAHRVTYHGHLSQPDLAELMRKCSVMVLPSFYEGVPLVLVEALACGCSLVSTSLPGVMRELKPHLNEALEIVPMPRIMGADTPHPADLGEFSSNLESAIERAVSRPPVDVDGISFVNALEPFKWSAVFERVESVWKELILGPS